MPGSTGCSFFHPIFLGFRCCEEGLVVIYVARDHWRVKCRSDGAEAELG